MLSCCGYYNLLAWELNLRPAVTEIYEEVKFSLASSLETSVGLGFPQSLEVFIGIWECGDKADALSQLYTE